MIMSFLAKKNKIKYSKSAKSCRAFFELHCLLPNLLVGSFREVCIRKVKRQTCVDSQIPAAPGSSASSAAAVSSLLACRVEVGGGGDLRQGSRPLSRVQQLIRERGSQACIIELAVPAVS